jgi:hypothetical protein
VFHTADGWVLGVFAALSIVALWLS